MLSCVASLPVRVRRCNVCALHPQARRLWCLHYTRFIFTVVAATPARTFTHAILIHDRCGSTPSCLTLHAAQFIHFLEKSVHRVRRDNPWLTVRTFTQCSNDGATPVSRLSGVRLLEGAGCHAPLLPTFESVCPELCQVAFFPSPSETFFCA